MKNFLRFTAIGLLYAIFPEIVNQLYLKKSLFGFAGALAVYLVILICGFVLREIFNKIVKSNFWNSVLWFVSWGSVGLYIEWVYLGNAGAPWYVQIAMFVFWAGLLSLPVMFTENLLSASLKRVFVKYLVFWYVLIILAELVSSRFALRIWILGSDFFVCNFLLYFFQPGRFVPQYYDK